MGQNGESGGQWRLALIPAALSLAINLGLFLGVAANRPGYLSDYRSNNNPDAVHYVLLGRNFLTQGQYSRCEGPPFSPDALRTPVYPLFAGGLDLAGGAGAIYLAQGLLQAGSCLLLFALVRHHFGSLAALAASCFLATDLMLAVHNFEAMAEPLFIFLILASVYLCLPPLVGLARGERPGLLRFAIGGGILGVAILTRPAALYLPVILTGGLLAAGWWGKRLALGLAATLVLLLGTAPLPGLWIARNAVVFSIPRLTTVDAANNVYFVGGGAYQLRHGLSLKEAHALIAQEYQLPPYYVSQNPWVSDRPVAEIDAELRAASTRVMLKYPAELLQSSLLGIAKASVSHNVEVLAAMNGREWKAPGVGGLVRLKPDAVERLAANGLMLGAAFAWELTHALLALVLAALGSGFCLARRRDAATWALLAILGYFYLTVAVFGLEAFYRCRVPVLPFLYVFAGVGLARVLARLARLVPGATVSNQIEGPRAVT